MASMASQKAPAPRPSWTREPVSLSKVATAFASTAAWTQRQGTDGRDERDMSRPRGQEGEQCPGVVERRLVRVVLDGEKVEAETVDE